MRTMTIKLDNTNAFLSLLKICIGAQWTDPNGSTIIVSKDTVNTDDYQISVFDPNNKPLFHMRWDLINVLAAAPTVETEVTIVID